MGMDFLSFYIKIFIYFCTDYCTRVFQNCKYTNFAWIMSTLDIILLICFLPALCLGFQKGFIRQAVSIISIILGTWLAFTFASNLSTWIQGHIDGSGDTITIIAFAIILILSFIGFGLLGKFLEATLKMVDLGWFNKILGVILSFLKTILIIGLIIIIFESLNSRYFLVKETILEESMLYPMLKDLANIIFPYLKTLIFWNPA